MVPWGLSCDVTWFTKAYRGKIKQKKCSILKPCLLYVLPCFLQRIDMVPELLSSNLCSLRDDGDRYVLHVYTHVQSKCTTFQMRLVVAYQKLCKIVLFIFII